MVYSALKYDDGPVAIRFPRGNGVGVPMDEEFEDIPIGSWEVLKEGDDVAILTFGTTIPMALEAWEILAKSGISARVINARFIKPLDTKMLNLLYAENMPILTLEEAVLQGGFGSAVLEHAADHHENAIIDRMGIPDCFIEHGSVTKLLEEIGLTTPDLVDRVKSLMKRKTEKGLFT
jgi:1-deoxy-D-xylulose-5-phosphate synthase